MDLSVTSSPTGPQGMAWQHFSSGLWLRACLIFFVAWGLPASHAVAAPGDLDPAFGTDGKVVTNLGGTEAAYSVALQTDGKIVVAGISNANGSDDFMVTRYLEDGTLDASFGTGGTVLTDLSGAGSTDLGRRLAIQPDGKIVVVGETNAGTGGKNYALARYMPDGTLDSGFGTGGLVVLDGGSSLNDGLSSIVIQPDGKLVVSGYFTHSVSGGSQLGVTLRFLANGAIDTSFASGGTSTIALPGKPHWSFDVALDASGRILVAGFGPQPSFLGYLTRLTANGSPDLSFNGGQVVTVEFSTGASSWCNTVNVQSDGKILVGGARWTQHSDFALERYLDNGTLDNSFGTAGVTTTDYTGNEEEVIDIAIDAHDRIITAGFQLDAADVELFGIHRYTRDGILDTTFGTGGRVLTTFGAVIDNSAYAVVLDVDGSIVAAGNAGSDIAVVRYEGGPTAPELVVTGNSTLIIDGDITPSTADHTDFGSAQITGGTVTRTYTVQNSGDGALTLGSVTITGAHAADFIVAAQPAASVAAGGSTTFQITFDPSAAGVRSATMNLTTNDGDESAFDFAIQGLGTGLPSPGQIIRPGNLSTGLKGWWKLEEASGTRMDSSGTGNHLTSNNVGSVVEDYWSTGERSADFERDSGQYLSITHAAQSGLSLSGSFTLAAWVRPESIAGDGIMLGKWTPSTGYMLSYNASDGGTVNSFVDNNGNPKIYTDLVAGRWIHLVAVYDQAQNVISKYANGNLISVHSQATPPSQNSAEFRLGLRGDGADALDGLLKDVAVWDRPLSSLEVKSLASGIDVSTAYRPGNVSVAPTAWWKLDEIANGSTAVSRADSAAVSHPLTDNNTVQTGGGYLNGAAADFVAANSEYLTAPDSPDWTVGSGNASLSTWVRFRTLTGGSHYPIFSHSQDSMNYWMVYLYYTGGRHWLTLANAVSNVVTLELLADWQPKPGVWYHMAWTKSGTEHRFYVDGRPLGAPQTHATPLTDFAGPITIGRLPGTGVYLDGQQADVAFWKGYALSDAEIKALATALPVQKAGIVSYWPLDEASGTRSDAIGTNHLSPINSPASAAGLVGTAADFESTNSQYLKITSGAQSGLNPTGALSVFGWVKPESTGSIQVIAARGYGNSGYGLSYRAGGAAQFDTGPGAASSTSTVSAGNWSFLGGVWDGVRKVYFNGAIESNGAGTGPSTTTHDFTLGANDMPGEYTDGLVDEVLVAGRWFRDEEVKAVYLRGLNGLNVVVPGEISVEQPETTVLADGAATSDFGTVMLGSGSVMKTFTIRNVGELDLSGLAVAKSGANAADFTLGSLGATTLAAGATTTFTVTFNPALPGDKTAAIHVTSNDADENTFDINLAGTGQGAFTATFSSASDTIITSPSFMATGSSVNLVLNFAPTPGTELRIVNNTGLPFIQGTFSNLAQGQAVALPFGTAVYNFVANYYGGTGNDLVLVWAKNRAFGWGDNVNYGSVGDGTTIQRPLPVPLLSTGLLANKTILEVATRADGSLILCSDGTLASWGRNNWGQVGDNSTNTRFTPVAVNAENGVSSLFGRLVVKIATGGEHCMVLCSDGTLSGWGSNQAGALGFGASSGTRIYPTQVANGEESALYGKTVVQVACGNAHNIALCADGTLVAWGDNSEGQLGTNGSPPSATKPVLVSRSQGVSALYGKDVIQVAASSQTSYALCSDGTLVSWGRSSYGQIGDGFTITRYLPVLVNTAEGTSALAGKSVVGISAGLTFVLARCSDGTLVSWGENDVGQLGDNSKTQRSNPTAVNTLNGTSSLHGKSVTEIATGSKFTLALASDGSLHAWGSNTYGQCGLNGGGSDVQVPNLVNTSQLSAGEQFIKLFRGFNSTHALAIVASPPPPPAVTTLAAASITGTSAVLNGTINANGSGAAASFDYGTFTGYGSNVAATPAVVTGDTDVAVTATLTGLQPGTQYFYRARGTDTVGSGLSFTTLSANADLASLTLSSGSLSPGFDAGTLSYTASVGYRTYSLTVTPTKTHANATITVNGVPVTSGAASGSILLSVGPNVITTVVTAQDGTTTKTYTVTVTRQTAAVGDAVEAFLPATNDDVYAIACQPDGKIILAGEFTTLAGSGRQRIGRLNADGTLDSGFNPGANGMIRSVAVQPDGKILVGGTFTTIGGVSRSRIARLLPDGTVDLSFNPNASSTVANLLIQPDGKIVLAGFFSTIGGASQYGLARLNADGSLDTGFNPVVDSDVTSLGLQTDGRILIAGIFTTVNGTGRNRIARLNADGSLDTAFNPDGAGEIRCLAVYADGKIAVGGLYSQIGGISRESLARLHPNGTLDTAFSADLNEIVYSMSLQADGKLIIAGNFTTVGGVGRNRVARLNVDGSLDPTFNPDVNAVVESIAIQPDGHVILGGLFSSVGSLPRAGLARVMNQPATQSLSAPNMNRIEWLRGDSSPQVPWAKFSVSTDAGASWIPLGAGTRISGGWELAGINLPTSGSIRAQAIAATGLNNGAGSLLQSDAVFSGLAVPDIAVFNGTTLTAPNERTDNTGTQSFGTADLASVNTVQTFSIRNDGTEALSGLALSIAGSHAGDFTLGSLGATTLAPGASTSFSVTFSPQGFGARGAVISLASNDIDETPFEIVVSGTGGNALAASFSAANTIPLTTNGFTATGSTVNLSLGYAPAPFSVLTVVNNTSANPITGTFTNLAQGQTVTLSFGGTDYHFFADYFGGDGNDLVLVMKGPGVLDYTFGGTGKVWTEKLPGNDQARAVAVQPDGKVVAVGHDGGDFVVMRYNVDGTLDSGFGTGGRVTTAIGTETDEAHGVAIQGDGKIIVAGFAQTSGMRSMAVVRYLSNGTLDTTFDGDGKAVSLVGAFGGEGRDVVLQSDGKIVVGGDYWSGTDTDFALVRFNSDGSLDTSFGTGGIVTVAQPGRHDEAACVALAPDGKIVLAGHYQQGTDYVIELARFQTNGVLDTTFSGDGIQTTQIGAAERAHDVVVQPDGKIVLVGQGPGGGGNDGRVIRYKANGDLDETFSDDGHVGLSMGNWGDYAHSVALQWDGKILVAGITEDGVAANFMLARLLADGTLDTSFNGTGMVSTSLGATSSDFAYGMALGPDGHIVLAGLTTTGGTWDFVAARYLVETERDAHFATAQTVPMHAISFSGTGQTVNLTLGFQPTAGQVLTLVNNTGTSAIAAEFTNLANGQIIPLTYSGITYSFLASYTGGTGNDLTLTALSGALDYAFGASGKRVTGFGSGNDTIYAAAQQADGKIVVAGFSWNGSNDDLALARYDVNGTLDSSFGSGGKVVTGIGSGNDEVRGIAIQADGRIVAAGASHNGTNNDFVVARYNADGTLDTSFGGGAGFVTTAVGSSNDVAQGVVVQADGRIVVAGEAHNGTNNDFAVVRYNANGTLDTSFDSTGKVLTNVGGADDFGEDVALQPDGRIVVAGRSSNGANTDFAVVRYTTTGALDTTFNSSGMALIPVGTSDDEGRGVAIQADGKILVGGHSVNGAGGNDFALIRLTSGGTLDGGFASGGKLLTPMSAGEDYCLSVAFQADGRILAGGYAVSGGNADFALLRLLPTGALDNTWLGTGKVLTPVGGGNDEGRVVLALADGSALLAGRSHNGSNYDFAVARYAAEAEVQTHFTSAGTVALQSPLFSATGRTVNITLGFAPPLGTELLLLNNTGFHPISGEFANLAHGATVPLTFNSVNYGFVANYFGGDGNDLTLERAGTKLAAFGANESGQLGITGAATQANVPTQVVGTAPIYQKTILSMSAGQAHSLAVASDGTVAAWGSNANGQLGNGTTTSATTPVAVTMSGVLAGKKVIAVAAGGQHSLALCSDGTLAAWGDGSFGQIGDNGVLDRTSPVLVSTSGALNGKRVTAISAGASHSAALCSDGTVVCWGGNTNGELGNGNNTQSNVPVAVATSGVLLGHTAIAIACGQNHTLALLADGTVAAWGLNASGQLGNNSTTPSNVPALVSTAGVLNGKSVVEIAAGGQSALVRCSDGILAAWGLNDRGQLGVNSATTSFTTPQAVLTSGVLSGKTIVSLHMSQNHAGALCSDGSLAMWGAGNSGQLGNNAVSDSLAPVLANNAILGSTDLFIQTASGGTAGHTLALIGTAANEPKIVVEHEGGSLSHNSLPPVNFGSLVAGAYRTKGFVIRNAGTQTLAGISAATLGADAGMFVIQSQPQATLPPGEAAEVVLRFNPQSIGGRTASLQITSNGVPSPFIVNLEGSGDPELNINWQTGREVPAQAAGFDANGYEAVLSLGFDPQPGARLMMLENTGLSFIEGIFTNTFYGVLVHGQLIDLNHAGKDYTFVVNYYGGDGNDLVLEWAGNRLVSWGLNSGGALGNGSSTPTFTMLPSAVSVTTPLSGKTILSAACGFNHSLALCSDGVVAAWGTNSAGQLGNNSTTSSSSPVAVNQTGVLSGRQVVAVAAGTNFSVALCSDGRIATWGSDADGQLGNDAAFSNSSVPVLVDDSGVLAGRMVTFIAAGGSHVLALCSDGTLVAWGSSSGIAGGGQLGNGSGAPFKSGVPVAVSTAGVLSGKTIARIAAGVTHSLAWCTDGTFAAWGENPYGMLGNGTNTSSSVPVVTTASGELAGRTPVLLGAGVHHSIMLGTDGLLSGWGRNVNAQLGVSTATTFYYSPINVPVTNAFGANVIEQLVPGRLHQLVCLSDGTIAAWGAGSTGQLGHGASPTSSVTPVYVSPGVLTAGERFARAYSGSSAQHNVALVAKPLTLPGGPPIVTTNAATSVDKTIATLNALVNPNSLATDARFEYGLTTSYGTQTALQTNIGSGGSDVTLTQALTGLQPNTTYHYRVIATNSGGSVQGNDLTFTTLPDPPVAVTTGSNSITNTSATLAGTVNPNTRATTIYFEFGTDTLYGNTTAPQNISAGSSNVNVIAPISGLTLGTTYHFRLVAQSAAGTAYGDDVVFTTTSISAPGLSLLTPDPITTTGATLKGNVNPNGAITTAWFEYGLTTTYTGITSVTGFGAVTSPQPVSLPVSSLTPATTYHYRLVAQNSAGTTQGADATFTTLPLPPIVETQAAAALSTTSARLHGAVNAQNGSAVVTFEWGTDGSTFPNALTAAQSPVTGNANTPVSVDITNLAQFTTYHFRVKATSSGGTTTGNVLTFQPAVISGLAQQFPNEPPASNGSLTVTLAPTGILSGWRFLGEHRWRASGDTVTGLVHGSRLIEFRPVPGYLQPGTDTVNVTASGQMADFEYYATPSSGTGGILVVLKPDTLAQAVNEAERGQWRLLGETTWRNSGTTVSALPAGSYLVECKPVSGYATPVLVNIAVSSGQTVNPAIVYADAFSPTGTPPSVLSFGTVSTDATKPYGYVGQIRSNSGLGTGFAVKSRVVATAAHVVFDEGSLSAVQGLQWLLQEDAGGHEPLPVTPRGYYLIDGYATQRAAETPGSFSLASRQKDVAALYFINDTDAARTGFAGFLASDLTNNEFLISNAQKMLVGYPVDGIAALDQGRMHATPAANLSFTGFAFPNDRVFATSGIRSTGGNSGGPLCVQHTNGNWYPAAIYLGGATQSIVRAIDSQVIQLFDTAQQSGIDDQGYTGGGITHSGYNGTTTTSVGAAIINITPAGSGWRPAGSTRSWTMSGNARVGLPAGELFVEFIPVSGYQVPTNHSIFVVANSTETFSITFQSSQTPQETWRQTYFGTTANSGDAADSHDYDRDGFTNAQEYAAGTNPTLSGDFFKTENPQRSGNTFSVSTAGKTGRTYILERSATMTNGTWTTVDTEGPLAVDLPVSLTDPSSPAGTAFYRIRVTGP